MFRDIIIQNKDSLRLYGTSLCAYLVSNLGALDEWVKIITSIVMLMVSVLTVIKLGYDLKDKIKKNERIEKLAKELDRKDESLLGKE